MKKIIFAFLFGIFAIQASAQEETGTVILLVDISSSINNEQMLLQIDSYVTVLQSVASVRTKRVVPIVFSSTNELLSNGSYMDAVQAFKNYPIVDPEYRGSTCLSDALLFIESIITSLPKPVVLDISGDGEANCANVKQIHPTLNRIETNHGAQVNTLYIDNNIPRAISDDLKAHEFYKSLRRNGGFTMSTESFMDFELSLFEKLTLEISWLDSKLLYK